MKKDRSEYNKQWRLKNPEKYLETRRIYREKHKEEIAEKRAKNREEHKIYAKEYYNNNIEKIKLYYSQEHIKKKNKENKRKNSILIRERRLKKNWNLTIMEYNKMFDDQHGCCAICNTHQSKVKKSFSVDHNHATGKIRGLLCNTCNTSLGGFKDDINIIFKAIEYLKKYQIS